MANLLDGKVMAQEIEESLKLRVAALKEQGVEVGLTVILVGEDPASQTYVGNKEKACARLGIRSNTLRMPADTTQETLEKAIMEANQDPSVHGILVQLPLPRHLDEAKALSLIVPEKDVDGFHDVNTGRLCRGQDCVVACTPKGALYMLKQAGIQLEGKEAVVIGRSNIVGKPMAMLLLHSNGTVTICHSRTRNLEEVTRRADILVVAVGRANFITADMVKEGAVVIDVGMNRNAEGKLCGDVDFAAVEPVASMITPVPGGVGPMTITMLLKNTLTAAKSFCARKK